ncbi:MAG: hypothetical protein WCJ97_12670, partial [Phycisphaerae bacterium]
ECLTNIGKRVAIGEVFTVVGYVGGKGLNHVAPGLTDDIGKGIGEMIHGSGDDVAKGVGNAVSGSGDDIAKGVGNAVSGSGDDIAKGASHGVGTAAGEDLGHAAGKTHVPDLNPEQVATQGKMTNALETLKHDGEAGQAAVNDLYKDGGMKKLADLERTGAVTPAQAAQINKQITNTVNESVDKATKNTINEMNEAGVKVKEVLVGDSGSSAGRSPGARSLKTDGDRTILVQFDKDSLEEYARKSNMTPAEAHDHLNKIYTEVHNKNMDIELAKKGLTPDDVGAKSYSGMSGDVGSGLPSGSHAGAAASEAGLKIKPPDDSYGSGFTGARQSAQGKVTVYNGQTGASHTASADAIMDQTQMNKAKFGGKPDFDPNRMTKPEFHEIINQQQKTLEDLAKEGHSGFIDPKSAAKAVNRFNLAQQGLHTSVPPPTSNFNSIASQIGKNPQSMPQILKANGMTEAQFNAMATKYVKSISFPKPKV